MRMKLAAAVLCVVAIACNEQAPTAVRPRPNAPSRTVAAQAASPFDTSDIVVLPSGFYHRECVRAVPNGGHLDRDGVVRTREGVAIQYAPCNRPGPIPKDAPEVALSPWGHSGRAGLGGVAGITPPTVNGYIESATAFAATGHVFRYLGADFSAPLGPASYSSGNIIFIFPGMQNNANTSTQSILQPVLQHGSNGMNNIGNNWGFFAYLCQGPNDPCYYTTAGPTISAGDQLQTYMSASNCSAGKCDWTISYYNATVGGAGYSMTVSAGTPTKGQTNDTYTEALGGALEVYGITSCDQLPQGPIRFNTLVLADNYGGISSPSWYPGIVSGLTPQCGYGVDTTYTTVTVHDDSTSALHAYISGPTYVVDGGSGTWNSSIASAPHNGTSPYTYSWSGILSGSSSSVSGVPSGTGYLYLTVHDANGLVSQASQYVTVCAPGQLQC